MAQMDQAYEVDGQYVSPESYEAMRREKLKTLYSGLAKQRDDWVAHRSKSGVENRWRLAQSMYLGDADEKLDDSFVDTLKNGPASRKKAAQANRSRVVINIVRPKVDQAVARMCEILLPVDDRNWGIKPTPVPEMVSKMIGNQAETLDDAGRPTGRTADQEAQIVMKQAKDQAAAMEKEIDDTLNECSYNGEQRKLIEEGVRLGTGLILGPFPKNCPKRSWLPLPDKSMKLKIAYEVKPASMHVSLYHIWFDPACGGDHQRGQGFYHQRFATKKELRDLMGIPGYDEQAIREVLKNKPNRTKVSNGKVEKVACDEDSYEMWVYYGQVEPDHMEMLCEAAGNPVEDEVVDGVLVMVGDTIIGAMESWVPDGSLPIDRWVWRSSEDSPYGYGLPDEMVHQQRVVNAAWRQVMDDGKLSLGGQLVMKKGMVVPQDGSYEMYPGKVWLANSELEDVRQAFYSFEFANHSQPLLGIATAAMQFADQETSMPQIMGGEKGTAPETVGGMVMLFNNSNVVLRMRVKLYDDNVTRNHLRRHYDWQMANSENQNIKGDMEIDARGSTALLEKDIQNQATLNLANVTSNPRYAMFLDPKEELKVILKAFKVNPEDIMLTEEKIEQAEQNAQQQPPDPRVQAAQMQLEGKQMEIADRKEQRMVDQQIAADGNQIKREQITYTAERERAESVQAQTDNQLDRELAIIGMQQDGIESQEERASKERLQAIALDQKAQLFNAEAAIKARHGSGI
jgi:hypothetical protein